MTERPEPNTPTFLTDWPFSWLLPRTCAWCSNGEDTVWDRLWVARLPNRVSLRLHRLGHWKIGQWWHHRFHARGRRRVYGKQP